MSGKKATGHNTSVEQLQKKFFDVRIKRALNEEMGITAFNEMQIMALPKFMSGKDILLKSHTGSGKTIAFAIPLIQRLLDKRIASPDLVAGFGIVACPTKDLSHQISSVFSSLSLFCSEEISVIDTCADPKPYSEADQVIIGTPKNLITMLKTIPKKYLDAGLHGVVIDEADVVLSYGYENDLKELLKLLPPMTQRKFQSVLCSATLNTDVSTLKKIWLVRPCIIDFRSDVNAANQEKLETQESFLCGYKELDKYLVLYALLKLNVLRKRIIIFSNSIKSAYTVRMFLEKFGIISGVLSPLLPARSRTSLMLAFNQGVIDVIIGVEDGQKDSFIMEEPKSGKVDLDNDDDDNDEAEAEAEGEEDLPMSDEENKDTEDDEEDGEEVKEEENEEVKQEVLEIKEEETNDEIGESSNPKKKKQHYEKESDFASHRGLDLEGVMTVINMDAPKSIVPYLHRIGRTNRTGNGGEALTMFSPNQEKLAEEFIKARNGKLKEFGLKLEDVKCLKYRVEDILAECTKSAVAFNMSREIQLEALHSDRLVNYFTDNPSDHLALRKTIKKLRTKGGRSSHLELLPTYLKPGATAVAADLTPVQKAIAVASGSARGVDLLRKKDSDFQTLIAMKKAKINRLVQKKKDRKKKLRKPKSITGKRAFAWKRKASKIAKLYSYNKN
eukprot:GHVP01061362.1.p1 GENE.GHVP01061362.1~~GHVP01061362.1.p1  ORF type:complete len:678 (+),score=154.38 GHVP01061362.1:24-2036(+)